MKYIYTLKSCIKIGKKAQEQKSDLQNFMQFIIFKRIQQCKVGNVCFKEKR